MAHNGLSIPKSKTPFSYLLWEDDHWKDNVLYQRQDRMHWWILSLQVKELGLKHMINWKYLIVDYHNREVKIPLSGQSRTLLMFVPIIILCYSRRLRWTRSFNWFYHLVIALLSDSLLPTSPALVILWSNKHFVQ